MLEPDEVTARLRLRKLGWGSEHLAREFGCSRTTVKRWPGSDRWQTQRCRALGNVAENETWVRQWFFRRRSKLRFLT